MIQIKDIGHLWPLDVNGYIINNSSIDKVSAEFQTVINETIKIYRKHLGSDLHSVYIRGSVPRGLGIRNISDLDSIAITNKKTADLDLTWVNPAEKEINSEYDFVDGVEFSFYCIDDILNRTTFSIIPFMIKTHSINVYGEDLRSKLPDYKADKRLGNEHLIHLKSLIELAKEDLIDNEDKEDILDCCKWIMKILVRAGLALTIEKEYRYTRDLFPAYKLFSKYYAEKEATMMQAVQYAINPTSNKSEIIAFLDNFGVWMIEESDKWLHVYNPYKLYHMEL